MSITNWFIDKSDLDVEAGNAAGGFDADGIHDCCKEFENYASCKVSPVPTLDLGAVTKVHLKCDDGIDLSEKYPSAVPETLEDAKVIMRTESNHWYDPNLPI